ncbi:protochlorophyllide-dependent translocon component 52, chloroplastic [Magnolia sinica]|uniref:protochlorophyllide-dependent translocon component 52, chloroplastic n=1 Tax=Magnolia sinica TaxID=86752 RepID=UPI002657D98C|nr:protochlorophyllide-dependent translocon component 52, chloroplastic [Magnolia sinica]
MEAFHPFPSPSFNLSILRTKHSIPFKKPIFSLPFKHPKSHLFSIFKDKNQFKIFSTATSSTISTTDTEPTAPDLEFEEEKEKFDWYSNWYPIMPVCDLDKKVPHAKTVMGLDVVVWWDRMEEKWQVFDDRCPHRLAPLSEGRIDQWGRLQCVYHGWCFDGAGDCKLIPQAPLDGPPINTFKKACAAVYPSCEQNKIVWFWPSTEPQFKDILMKEKPPYIPELDDPSYTSLYGNRDIPYGYEVLVENLMDPAHVPYAHYGIMRIPNAKNRPKRDREGGRPMEISVETLNGNGFFANQGFGYSKFMAPCIFYAFPKSAPSYELSTSMSIEQESSTNSDQRQRISLLIFVCIPVSPGQSRLIWVFPRNFSQWLDRIVPRWMFHVGQNLILDSDLYLLHLEERKIAEVGPSNWQKACFVPTKSDALVVGFRKWLRKYAGGQIKWGNKFDVGLLPIPPREQLLDRYWSHVVNCSSCRVAVKGLKALEVSLQVISLASIAIVAALKQNVMSTVSRSVVVSMAVVCFLASKWLSHFIYKNFYYHDYNHALK